MSVVPNARALPSASPSRTLGGIVTGVVALTLRMEGGAALAVFALAYCATGASWWLFAVLFLAPDLTMLGYLFNRRIGAALYNLGHTYLTPAALALAGVVLGEPAFWLTGLTWGAHIGFDRLLGYGLKYPQAFQATHLGWTGKGELDGLPDRQSM